MIRQGFRPAGAALAAALAGCVLALSAGCAGAPERPRDPAPTTSSPADVCTSLVSYWVKEALKGSKWAGLDWEQKGMSNEQYEIHDEVLVAARAEERRAGRPAAFALTDRETRRRCEAAKGATGSSENWRPPSEQRAPTSGSRPSPS
ncbi:hypothetical protein ABZV60_13950 [Streptomyces sp. NPDC004787]|uniref:hypothetical protein n=1 Tax=Streptomyces sp. NPDC004787 TaxID=3154291 RepID=UPI0033A5CDD6